MPTDSTRLALVIAAILLLIPGAPSSSHLVFLITIAVLLAISTRRTLRRTTIVVLLLGMIVIRLALTDTTGSDVLIVTEAAIKRVLAGFSPYAVGYSESTPPGAPFPYGPVALLWYIPLRDISEVMELGAAIVVALVLALRGRLVGLAVYAAAPVLVQTSIDGSNDTSLGLLILAAFMAAGRWPAIGGGILGIAVGFKLSALAFVPMYMAWGGARVAASVASVSLMAWAPVIGGWGITSFLASVRMANDAHNDTVWTLGKIVNDITKHRLAFMDQLRFLLGGGVAVASLFIPRRSLDTVILTGIAVYIVTLFGGNWATFAYFAGIAPLVCWRLDDWLGLPSTPLIREPERFLGPLRGTWPLRLLWRSPDSGETPDREPETAPA